MPSRPSPSSSLLISRYGDIIPDPQHGFADHKKYLAELPARLSAPSALEPTGLASPLLASNLSRNSSRIPPPLLPSPSACCIPEQQSCVEGGCSSSSIGYVIGNYDIVIGHKYNVLCACVCMRVGVWFGGARPWCGNVILDIQRGDAAEGHKTFIKLKL